MDYSPWGHRDPEKPCMTNQSLQCDYKNVLKGCELATVTTRRLVGEGKIGDWGGRNGSGS